MGAGAGSYEPPQTILAIEPSLVMLRQRVAAASPVVRARAEALPVLDGAADAAMALLTVHHWTDVGAGIAELRRIARRRVVILTWDQRVTRDFWLMSEYLPEVAAFEDRRAVPVPRLVELLGGARAESVPVPHDCTDGFGVRPTGDGPRPTWIRWCVPVCRCSPSTMTTRCGPASNAWPPTSRPGDGHQRHRELLDRDEFDAGYRLLIADI